VLWASVACAVLASPLACDVDATEPETTGVDLGTRDSNDSDDDDSNDDDSNDDDSNDDAGTDAGGAELSPSGPEPSRGFVVIHSDYESSTVSVLDPHGEVLASTLVSSGSAPPGLSLALDSDIIFPTQIMLGDELVIVDRGNNVIHWVDFESAEVTRQLNVGPGGFAANPYDYVEISADKAYVTRYATNGEPGAATFDEGGDLLIIDPTEARILGRIDLQQALSEVEVDAGLQPRPDSIVVANGTVFVLLAVVDADFAGYGEPRVVRVDPVRDEVVSVLPLGDLRNCGELRLSPNELQLAVACIGDWSGDPIVTSGIVLVDLSSGEPEVIGSTAATELTGTQVSSVEFATDTLLLFTATGSYDEAFNPVSGDVLYSLALDSGEISEGPLVETTSPYNLGEVRCAHVEKTCVLADAETEAGVLHVLEVEGNSVSVAGQTKVEDGVGHPPRYIGRF
jgi:hypothetical protein